MGTHSITEAANQLPSLIDEALNGEEVVITREGRPVAELRAIRPNAEPKPMSGSSLEWLRTHRIKPRKLGNAAKLVSEMRDEDDERLS